MGATLARSAAIGQRAITISAGPPLRRGALRGAHENQAAHAHLHGIECVERLGLNSLLAEASARCCSEGFGRRRSLAFYRLSYKTSKDPVDRSAFYTQCVG